MSLDDLSGPNITDAPVSLADTSDQFDPADAQDTAPTASIVDQAPVQDPFSLYRLPMPETMARAANDPVVRTSADLPSQADFQLANFSISGDPKVSARHDGTVVGTQSLEVYRPGATGPSIMGDFLVATTQAKGKGLADVDTRATSYTHLSTGNRTFVLGNTETRPADWRPGTSGNADNENAPLNPLAFSRAMPVANPSENTGAIPDTSLPRPASDTPPESGVQQMPPVMRTATSNAEQPDTGIGGPLGGNVKDTAVVPGNAVGVPTEADMARRFGAMPQFVAPVLKPGGAITSPEAAQNNIPSTKVEPRKTSPSSYVVGPGDGNSALALGQQSFSTNANRSPDTGRLVPPIKEPDTLGTRTRSTILGQQDSQTAGQGITAGVRNSAHPGRADQPGGNVDSRVPVRPDRIQPQGNLSEVSARAGSPDSAKKPAIENAVPVTQAITTRGTADLVRHQTISDSPVPGTERKVEVGQLPSIQKTVVNPLPAQIADSKVVNTPQPEARTVPTKINDNLSPILTAAENRSRIIDARPASTNPRTTSGELTAAQTGRGVLLEGGRQAIQPVATQRSIEIARAAGNDLTAKARTDVKIVTTGGVVQAPGTTRSDVATTAKPGIKLVGDKAPTDKPSAHIEAGRRVAAPGTGVLKGDVAAIRVVRNDSIKAPASAVDGNIVKAPKPTGVKAILEGNLIPGGSKAPGIKVGTEKTEAAAITATRPGAVKSITEKVEGKTINGVWIGRKLGGERSDTVGTGNTSKAPGGKIAAETEGRTFGGTKIGSAKLIGNIADGRVPSGKLGTAFGSSDKATENKTFIGNKIGSSKVLVGEKVDAKKIDAKRVDVKDIIANNKIGAAKVGEKADAKAISATFKAGIAKFVGEKVDPKAMSCPKLGISRILGEKADAKASVVNGKVGVAKSAVFGEKADAKGIVAGGKVATAKSAVLGEKADKADKAIVGQKAGAARVGPAEKCDIKAGRNKLGGVGAKAAAAEKAEAKAEAKSIAKSAKVNGGSNNKLDNAKSDASIKGGKAAGSIAAAAEGKQIKSSAMPGAARTGGERVDNANAGKGRPLDAVAKIFGIALGTEKSTGDILGSRSVKPVSSRSEADRVDSKDKLASRNEDNARRLVGNGSLSTELLTGELNADADGDTEDNFKKKDSKISKRAGARDTQMADKLHWMMQIAEAGLNIGDRRTAKRTGSKESQALFKQAGRRRRRYTIKYGDNIRSIARVQLGDERFAALIVTINRGSAGFYMLPDNKTPHLLVDQVIWLPSDAEMEIHKKHHFARGTVAGEQQIAPVIDAVSPNANTIPEVEMEIVNLPEVEFMQSENTEAYTPPTVSYEQYQHEVAAILQRLRNVGNRHAITLQEFEARCESNSPDGRRVYRVRLGDTLRSIALRDPLMQDQSLWPLIARINGISELRDGTTGHPTVSLTRGNTIYLPSEEEVKQFRLMNRLASYANHATQCTAETDLLATDPGYNGHPSIQNLSQSCRINSSEIQGDDAYVSKLEMQIGGDWITVATYDYRHGHAFRYIHRRNGSVAAFPMDLPLEIVREMSREDFARNWTTYCLDFATVSSGALGKSS